MIDRSLSRLRRTRCRIFLSLYILLVKKKVNHFLKKVQSTRNSRDALQILQKKMAPSIFYIIKFLFGCLVAATTTTTTTMMMTMMIMMMINNNTLGSPVGGLTLTKIFKNSFLKALFQFFLHLFSNFIFEKSRSAKICLCFSLTLFTS